jgi:hypothetical protein
VGLFDGAPNLFSPHRREHAIGLLDEIFMVANFDDLWMTEAVDYFRQ